MNAAVPLHVVEPSDAKVLTGDGGRYEIPRVDRESLAFLDDGTLLIVHGQELEQNVMAFMDDLTRKGVAYDLKPCSLEEIRRWYDGAQPGSLGGPKSRTQGTKPDVERQAQAIDIFGRAKAIGASDIHIVGNHASDLCELLFRVHGLLEPYETAPGKPFIVDELVSGRELRAAIYSGMCDVARATFQPGNPQDARVAERFVKKLGLYGARVATGPLDKGQQMVIRLFEKRDLSTLTLEQLGYLPEQAKIQYDVSEQRRGMTFIAGETGSGKSTTLQLTMARTIRHHRGQLHVLGLEDPPENEVPGMRHYPIKNGDWAGAIANAMRLDPDIMMIGEIRDLLSAQAAFRAALAGHGVRTSVHTNGPWSTLTRLADLGVEKYLWSDWGLVKVSMHQGLVPTLCPYCRIPWADLKHCNWLADVSAEQIARIERHVNADQVYLCNPQGCAHPKCHKGHDGRTVIARVVAINAKNMGVYLQRGGAAANDYWINEEGGITHTAHLRVRINEGRVDPIVGERMIAHLDDIYD